MEEEEVKKLLKGYKDNVCNFERLKIKKEACIKQLELNGLEYTEDAKEAIEGMQLSAMTISDMPISRGLPSSKTERTAIHYFNELTGVNSFDVEGIKSNIKSLDYQMFVLESKIKIIESALKSLNVKELFVIEGVFFLGYYKNELVSYYYKRFGYGSKRTIDRNLKEAFDKLEKALI